MPSIKNLTIILVALLIAACTSQNKSKGSKNFISQSDSLSFQYSEVTGIGLDSVYNRRDNSDVIKVGNTYYVWYTRMDSPVTSGYWGSIWYATSVDEGHTWQEQGKAVGLGEEGAFDSHSVFTPNILVFQNKYYLYYTGVKPTLGRSDKVFEGNSTNDFTAIGLAVADSPDGPFKRVENNPVLRVSKLAEDFDSYRIDDASLIIRDKKIWLYYKGRSIVDGKNGPRRTKMGVAIANQPEGPFTKTKGAIMDKSHEVLIWKEGKGIASLASVNFSINYADDALNFEPLYSNLKQIPKAPGLYRPFLTDAETSEIPGWGICMIYENKKTYLRRFEMLRR
ncbi:family 43 glycosylhydrolase [Labilibaculum sp.]|uniref:family 43 glycosylhydrolase n=1 Tax=Labilibaculum sp. TaxID=2060723 RepID=UPI003563F2FF